MDKQELKEALISLGVKPRHHTIDGGCFQDSTWVLEMSFNHFLFDKKYKVWNVFFIERGQRYDEKIFYKEEEACRYIYEKLKHSQETINKFKLKD
jgi:hypothetical protein